MAIENMIPVISSNIAAYGYDPETKVLDVLFINSDTTYSYDEVPQEVFTGFEGAVSKGSYFKNNIKGRYRFFTS